MPNAVEQVPDRTGEHEGEGESDGRLGELRAEQVHEDEGDASDAGHREERRRILEEAEGSAGVRVVDEADRPRLRRPGFTERERGADQGLRRLVDRHDAADEAEEPAIGATKTSPAAGNGRRRAGGLAHPRPPS